MVLCDTDIFIEAFKNRKVATDLFRRIGFDNIALSVITLMELYFGALNKRELSKIKNRLEALEIIDLKKEISGTAVILKVKTQIPSLLLPTKPLFPSLPSVKNDNKKA